MQGLEFERLGCRGEHNSVARDVACNNMQGLEFEPWYIYLFTWKGEIVATRLLEQKRKTLNRSYNITVFDIVKTATQPWLRPHQPHLIQNIKNSDATT